MVSKFSKAERDALDEKMEHPERVVYCPRCGKEIELQIFGSGCVAKCQTEGCIKETIRGL